MGIVQCSNSKEKNEIWNLIEKSINNKKTTLDKKIYEEYYYLKDLIKPIKKPEKRDSKNRDKESFPIIYKKNNFISLKKRIKRFSNWYFMSHPNQNNKINKKINYSETKIKDNNINDYLSNNNQTNAIISNENKSRMKKTPSEANLKYLKDKNLNNEILFDENCEKNDNLYFNNTMKIKNNDNEISPIFMNKKVQFLNDSEKNQTNGNITINLSSRFSNFNNREINKNDEFLNSFQNNNVNNTNINNNSNTSNFRNNFNLSSSTNLNFNFRNSKLASGINIPNLNNNNLDNKFTLNNICNKDSIMKIKYHKDENSVKILKKFAENEHDTSNAYNINNNYSDCSSSRQLESKKSNNSTNQQNCQNISDQSSKSNIDKSTTARINNKNTLSKSNTMQKEDSNSNSQTEKNQNLNNIYNSSAENEAISNSIYQQLSIFDDSNIIESNLRLSFKLNKDKFLKRTSKGPPDSFRWMAWIITCNLPIERNKDFFNYLLSQPLNQDTDIQIKKDLNRTLSGIKLCNFVMDDSQLILYNILKAFSHIDKEVSYCQGMNFIVGFLLLMSDFNEIETFYFMLALFSNTFKENLGVRGFFLEGFPLSDFYVSVFLSLFNKNLPDLKKHFDKLEIPDEVWISKWYRTLFTLSLPFEICMRIWDCIIVFGLDFLLNFTLAFMKYIEQDLLKKDDLFDVIEYFKKMSPIFAIENEGDDNVIAESAKLMENFNIEEIIQNANKIKITQSFLKEQMQLYEKKNNMNFSKLKIKYDLGFNDSEKSFNNQNDDFKNFCNSNLNDNFSEYYIGEKKNEFYINTETCRSEIEKIKNNLEPKTTKSSKNLFNINDENFLQKMKSSDSNVNKNSNIHRIQTKENNKIIKNSNRIDENHEVENIGKINNNSGDFDNSINNSDSETNVNVGIQEKIMSYTFKTKLNKNQTDNILDDKLHGKID